MKKKIDLKEKFRQFREWQRAPRTVAPNTAEEHECANCHDHYQGRFCPRCGQPSQVGRYSFVTAVTQFLEAAGMGEHGVFRTLKELILRPGYLIRDYLNGMQASFFGPFKLFFLLAAVSISVTHGLNIKGLNPFSGHDSGSGVQEEATVGSDSVATSVETVVSADFAEDKDQVAERTKEIVSDIVDKFWNLRERFPEIYNLLLLMLESVFIFLFFRHSPNIPDLRFSELFVALIYTANMVTVFDIFFNFFCLKQLTKYTFVLALIPLKQLSGYSYLRTAIKSVAAFALMILALLLFILVSVFLTIELVKWFG